MIVLSRKKKRKALPDVVLHPTYQLTELAYMMDKAIEAQAVLVLVADSGDKIRFRPAEYANVSLASKEFKND